MKSHFATFCLIGSLALAPVALTDAKVVFTSVTTAEGTGVSATQTTQVTNEDGSVVTTTRTETTITKEDGTIEEVIEILEQNAVPDNSSASGFLTTITVLTTVFETPPGGTREEVSSDTDVQDPIDAAPPELPEEPTFETDDDTAVISEP